MSSQERANARAHYRQIRRQKKLRVLRMTLLFGLLASLFIGGGLWLLNSVGHAGGSWFSHHATQELPPVR